MNFYILRHGIAVERGAPGYRRDSDRPLTSKGKRKMRRIAKTMRAMKLSFDLILSSPFARAKQTAEIVAESFKAGKRLAFSDELAVGGNPKELIEQIKHLTPQPQKILLVGHEPYLSGLISLLVAGNSGLPVALKKGGLCRLEIESLKYGRCATLEWLLAPAQMEMMN